MYLRVLGKKLIVEGSVDINFEKIVNGFVVNWFVVDCLVIICFVVDCFVIICFVVDYVLLFIL